MAGAADEKRVKALLESIRRLPHNKRCVNCDKESAMGFGDVCEKFSSFVCHPCKSAHQSFSHRCKSVSLSNWTLAEVQKLSDQAGGGNAHARQTWLGKLDGKLVLRPDDPLEKVKAFVNEAYNYKKYWREPSGDGTHSPVAATESPVASRKDMAVPSTQQPSHRVAPRAPAAPATADFLDFAADFTSASTPSPSSGSGFSFINPPQQQGHGSTTTTTTANNDWEPFGAFVTATSRASTPASPPPPPPPQQPHLNNGSAFGFMSSPPPAPAHSSFAASSPTHDAFGSFMAASAPAPAPLPMAPTPLARPAPPPMVLSRPLVEDPFAVLAGPAAFGYGVSGGGGGYMGGQQQQQQQPPALPST